MSEKKRKLDESAVSLNAPTGDESVAETPKKRKKKKDKKNSA